MNNSCKQLKVFLFLNVVKFQGELTSEMNQLQGAIQPLIMKLSQGMGGMPGMGMPGMDMGGQMGGGQDPMMMGGGGMDGMGFSPEQLQQLQMQDPEGFAQLMSMMQR